MSVREALKRPAPALTRDSRSHHSDDDIESLLPPRPISYADASPALRSPPHVHRRDRLRSLLTPQQRISGVRWSRASDEWEDIELEDHYVSPGPWHLDALPRNEGNDDSGPGGRLPVLVKNWRRPALQTMMKCLVVTLVIVLIIVAAYYSTRPGRASGWRGRDDAKSFSRQDLHLGSLRGAPKRDIIITRLGTCCQIHCRRVCLYRVLGRHHLSRGTS